MCGRISFVVTAAREDYFQDYSFEYVPENRYNIAPSEYVAAVRNTGENVVEPLRWGLVPSWTKDVRMGYKMINARAETLAEKPAFRQPIKKKRCLILADGFYEWKHPRAGSSKIPYYVHMKNQEPFALAGLWDEWKPPDKDEPLRTCTVITTDPNEVVEELHNRMPVILNRDAYNFWLDPGTHEAEEFKDILVPYPASEMEAYQVSTRVNKPGYDSPELIKPVPVQGLDAFF
jgi:putative SOS response-associated peptidase YedK